VATLGGGQGELQADGAPDAPGALAKVAQEAEREQTLLEKQKVRPLLPAVDPLSSR
jgi:hypothetical protein